MKNNKPSIEQVANADKGYHFSYSATNYEDGIIFQQIYQSYRHDSTTETNTPNYIKITKYVVKHEQLIEIFGDKGVKMSVSEMYCTLYGHADKIAMATFIEIIEPVFSGVLPIEVNINGDKYENEFKRDVTMQFALNQLIGVEKCTSKAIKQKLKVIADLEHELVGNKTNISSFGV